MWRAHCPPREAIERVTAAPRTQVAWSLIRFFAAGGTNNILARLMGQSLSDQHLAARL